MAIPSERRPASAGPVRLGVLGCADVATRRILPALGTVDQISLVAVASRDAGRARAVAGEFGARPVAGYDRLLARADVDAVYLPLPNSLHAEWIERALRAGKHVLVEKPLATSHRRAARLFALARSRQLLLRENMMFPHHAQHAAVRALVDGGAIGTPHTFSATFVMPSRPADDIRYQSALGGGALLDGGVYPIRAAQFHLGPGLEVVGSTLRHDPARCVDLGGGALLRSASGVAAQLTFGMDGAYRTEYEIAGTQGRLRLERAFTPPADHQPTVAVARLDGAVEEIPLPADDQYGNALRAFADAVLTGGDDEGATRESLYQAALLDRIRAAAG